MDDADILVTDVDLGGIVLLGARLNGNAVVGEGAAQKALEFGEFSLVHDLLVPKRPMKEGETAAMPWPQAKGKLLAAVGARRGAATGCPAQRAGHPRTLRCQAAVSGAMKCDFRGFCTD
jgi:hypothetical protein